MSGEIAAEIEALYRRESRRVLASLIRLLGGFDAAEEALHEAFASAAAQWPQTGMPRNPVSWLISAGRFRAIDRMRRRARFDAAQAELLRQIEENSEVFEEDADIADDRLRLIFTCCHPALPPDGQVALTLREVMGLTTEEVARAYLTALPALAQRIVRAKARIREDGLPYEVPDAEALPARLASVLRVVYLVFNEGYAATAGPAPTRQILADEAIRLGRLICQLLPEPEAEGLLALMLLQNSRRDTRLDADGDIVLLADQDRSHWDHAAIAEAGTLVAHAMASRRPGPYVLQAAIAALHAEAPSAEATDWAEIVGLYDLLLAQDASPVIALNRAVAVAMRDGPEAGLALIERLLESGTLESYHLAHSAAADLRRRLGRREAARAAYLRALELARLEPEKRFLQARLRELD